LCHAGDARHERRGRGEWDATGDWVDAHAGADRTTLPVVPARKTAANKNAVPVAVKLKTGAVASIEPGPIATTLIAKAAASHNFSTSTGSKLVGSAFETRALEFLQRHRLRFIARNVSCRGGEIDLVMRERDGSLVFVEVRARRQRQYGGAAASIGWIKKQRIVRSAQHYLATYSGVSHDQPACRFDVIAFEAGRLVWLRDAFRADEV
jgi:putative endonuclease